MITFKKTNTKQELEQILLLQKKNLLQYLNNEEKAIEGFVTVEHNLSILQKMHDSCPHTIAVTQNKVVGYALSMTRNFSQSIPVLKPMFDEINTIVPHENYIVMGQICIDKNYRKQGVFKGLYQFMKNEVCSGKYDAIITEIDLKNSRSLAAHQAAGFETIKEYMADDKVWRIVRLVV